MDTRYGHSILSMHLTSTQRPHFLGTVNLVTLDPHTALKVGGAEVVYHHVLSHVPTGKEPVRINPTLQKGESPVNDKSTSRLWNRLTAGQS